MTCRPLDKKKDRQANNYLDRETGLTYRPSDIKLDRQKTKI